MATPAYLLNYKFPLTEKPVTLPTSKETYQDVFNLQNCIRLIVTNFTEEAPQDGKLYGRRNGVWEEIV